jgi:hypothetical protein
MTDESGEWHLVPMEHVDDMVSGGRVSVIVHQCGMWNTGLRSERDLPYEPLGYWNTAGCVGVACKLCNVAPPEAIASLFILHNFDTFAGDAARIDEAVIGQMIQNAVTQSFTHFEHTYFLGEKLDKHRCPCRGCWEGIGAWKR